jgi:diamine N-acetyltransferase
MTAEYLPRRAVSADLDAILRIERGPGYGEYVGRSDRSEHERMLDSPMFNYFVGADSHGEIAAFAILGAIDDPHGNVYLKRVAAARAGEGIGSAFLAALIDWVFSQTRAHRFHLDCFVHNTRAQAAYRKLGFSRDGMLRQAYLAPDGRRIDLALMALLRPEWEAARQPRS